MLVQVRVRSSSRRSLDARTFVGAIWIQTPDSNVYRRLVRVMSLFSARLGAEALTVGHFQSNSDFIVKYYKPTMFPLSFGGNPFAQAGTNQPLHPGDAQLRRIRLRSTS